MSNVAETHSKQTNCSHTRALKTKQSIKHKTREPYSQSPPVDIHTFDGAPNPHRQSDSSQSNFNQSGRQQVLADHE